ncbi:M3 family metallopeptidase [Ideonella sp. 4Y16]|uniref:M3 family metallopeptidase n=2 Tax=Ideonella alba TaxID=2824118 RepID=A0A940Y917_9BURK|nr:M3 family metallopeptidase [Ideonella alba]MBQ0942136.1 M3 family metallopeptidase [Ideonella alba]
MGLTGHTVAQPTAAAAQDNPLFSISPLPLQYPPFDRIRDEHFAPALERGMAEQLAEIQAIVDNPAAPSFDNTLVALERSGRLLSRTTTLLFSLLGVDANPARQQLQRDYAARLAAHRDAVQLNPRLFARVDAVYARRDEAAPNAEARRLVERVRLDMVRAGALLDDTQKARMRALNAELATLSARFNQAVLAEVNDSALVVATAEELAGLSPGEIAAAAEAARQRGLPGRYLITLLNTTIQPAEAALHDRALRERLHRASVARGSRGNAHDTTALLARVMSLRQERAALLGHPDHASQVLEDETARTPQAVQALLRRLTPAAVAAARQEAAALQALIDQEQAARQRPGFALQAWDWSYYAEKLRAARYGFDENQLRPYLEIRQVLERGVFFAAEQLYGLRFRRRTDLPVYHEDVWVYDVFDHDGRLLALFIADLYARPTKRGGAWMNAYVRYNALEGTSPVVANHLNVPKPPAGEPTLLTWDEVNTLFHEFGHALHGMFNTSRYPGLDRVPRDFVEYPSQVNEVWAYWPSVLAHYARHHQSGEPMPAELLAKVSRAKRFNQGYMTTSYLASAVLDQRWHRLRAGEVPAAADVMAFEARVLKEEGLDVPVVPPRYRTPYFSHIMGGYAAGYYAYVWSEVLDADTVAWLMARGGLTRENGDALRARLLSRGGSEDAMDLFRQLVGHEPHIEPLLERRGLVLDPR